MPGNLTIVNNTLVKYERTKADEDIVIPEGVTHIGSRAFDDHFLRTWYIFNPIIPPSVQYIDEYAFTGIWIEILKIDIPGTVLEIGDCAFSGRDEYDFVRSNVSEVVLNEGLKKIGSKAFYGQKRLKKLYLPTSLTYIADDAFENCSKQLKLYVSTEDCYAAQYLRDHNFAVRLIKKSKKTDARKQEQKQTSEAPLTLRIEQPPKYGYQIRIRKENAFSPSIFDSKYGGQPYWDRKRPFPRDSAGNDLALIAQFNLSNLHADAWPDILPKEGMLQFFISSDPALWKQNYKVVYHQSIDYAYEPSKWVPELEEEFPLGEMAIELVFCEDTRQEDDDYSGSWLLCHKGTRLNYHPIYESRKMQAKFNQMLFQLDSMDVRLNGVRRTAVNIGDWGFMSFFINATDLANQNFSDVFFHEDCC